MDDLEEIQTFVFMDFEVAGQLLETEFSGELQPRNAYGLDQTDFLQRLIAQDVDLTRVPRIAEMSFVFVPRALFSEAADNMHHKLKRIESEGREQPLKIELPMNVFTSQLNPELSEEDWKIYESKKASIRLRRSELLQKNTFAQEWPAVHHLLRISPKPACLVAHNGLQFDFRILAHELDRTGQLQKNPIPEGVFFLDSYLTFLDIEEAHHKGIQQTLNTIDWNLISSISTAQKQQEHQPSPSATESEEQQQKVAEEQQEQATTSANVNAVEEEENEIEYLGGDCPLWYNRPPSPVGSTSSSVIATDEEQNGNQAIHDHEQQQAERQEANVQMEVQQQQEEEEIQVIDEVVGQPVLNRRRTISGRVQQQIGCRKRKQPLEGLDPKHPFRYLRSSEWCPAKRRRIPANLLERDQDTGQWHFSQHASDRLLRRCGNFKLCNMFQVLIGSEFRPHRAQADSEALLQVSLAYGTDFLNLADSNRSAFPEKYREGAN